jgi:O-antigen/teichoic acid export membrane protein
LEQFSFKKKVLSGIFWNIIETIGRNFFRFVIGLILARLLEPSDYGLVGMVTIFITMAGVFIDSGLSTALIRNANSDSGDYSTVFFFNIGAGILFYLLIYMTAPLIANFFKQPLLIKIVRVIAINFVITSFGIVQNTIFFKQMNFKTLTKISLIAIFISGGTGILLAYYGYGVWALIVQGLLMTFISSILLWYFSGWKPSLYFNKNSLKRLYKFGSKLMLAGIINSFFQNIYRIVIGRLFTARDLGFYTKSEGIARTPSVNIYAIFQKVFLPSFSLIQEDNLRLKLVLKKVLIVSGFIIFPVMLGSIALAKPLILLVLTDKWSGSIPYLQLLCFSFMLYPFHALNINILNVKGRSDLVLKLEYIKKGAIILAILLTFKFGILALVTGQVVTSIFAVFINSRYSGKLINYPVSEQLRDLSPYFALSAVTTLVLFVPVIILDNKYLIQLLLQLLFGSSIYFISSRLLNLQAYFEVRNVIKDYSAMFIPQKKN